MFCRNAPAVADITPETVRQRLEAGERLHLIDVREPGEYAQGHIPGARLVPLGQLRDRLDGLDPAAETILVCRSGRRSDIACRILAGLGFERVRNLAGGMLAWRGPVAR